MITKCEFFYVLCTLVISCYSLPELLQVTPPTDHAEGPTWDSRTQTLLYVDIPQGIIFAYHYKNKSLFSVKLNGQVGMVVPSKSDSNLLIIGLNRTVIAIEWDRFSNPINNHQKLVTVSAKFPTSRFNDGKADKHGRLWFGTMANEDPIGHIRPNEGVLYKIDRHLRATPVIAPVSISNGLAWSKDNTKFFYIDSAVRRVFQYDFNASKGSLHNGRVCFDLAWYPKLQGVPDGMTIDKDDALWIALYGGGGVIQVDPKKGKVLRKIALPAKFATSAIWGGPALDILYVTTSRKDLKPEEKKLQPAAGSLFAIRNLGTSGLEAFRADVISQISE